ncbi:MAG: RNA polymerase subunit sigma-70 [Gemmatimonadaceae bacterium]|nr:RNA polymerase subunit sigma-70 [Gemmatimonadaceae bacterium]
MTTVDRPGGGGRGGGLGRGGGDPGDGVRAALEERFRSSHARIVAALTRRFGARHFALVEQAVQEAYVRALGQWTVHGLPDDAERWLVRVAHNAAVDALRRERSHLTLERAHDVSEADPPAFDAEDEVRLMFLCCDPSLSRAAQIALVANVAFGLTAAQIATAFVSDERTVAQRLVRAKQRLRERGVQFDVPAAGALPERLAALLDVLYVVFAEGYSPSVGEEAIDDGLCREALRFVRLLTSRDDTGSPAAFALHALLCFHAARAPARLADDGSLLLLAEQDRTRWDRALMDEAFGCLCRAGTGAELTRYHLEAGIAACHAAAPSYAATDWGRVVEMYAVLRARWPSLVVDINHALAVAMYAGTRAGLDELDAIPERDVLARYPYALAAYADLHASLGNLDEARHYLDRAIARQPAAAQAALLRRKRAALDR